jgi:hypothetical protein
MSIVICRPNEPTGHAVRRMISIGRRTMSAALRSAA